MIHVQIYLRALNISKCSFIERYMPIYGVWCTHSLFIQSLTHSVYLHVPNALYTNYRPHVIDTIRAQFTEAGKKKILLSKNLC